ncbi:unnamed protein product [Adineta steineri]|uniref:Uncharacterized protein n=1 Tax=Adineta steineri TaxID=433720 RepID=A0A814NGI7_9BILA|nr:unnamed protein product [Adineta steineri]
MHVFETFLRTYERIRQSNDIDNYNDVFEETKYETIHLFNDLLTSCCIDPLLINEKKTENVESLIDIFSQLITEKRFLSAYEDYFNLREILDIVHQTTELLDEEQVKFYTDAVKEAIELYGTPSCKQKLKSPSAATTTASASGNTSIKKSTNPDVHMIQDLFPHLDEAYIEVSWIENKM